MAKHDNGTIGLFSNGLGFACQCGFVRYAATETEAVAIATAHANAMNVPIWGQALWRQAVQDMQAIQDQILAPMVQRAWELMRDGEAIAMIDPGDIDAEEPSGIDEPETIGECVQFVHQLRRLRPSGVLSAPYPAAGGHAAVPSIGYAQPVSSDRCTLEQWKDEVEALCKEMGL